MSCPKITMPMDDLWIIRTVFTWEDGRSETRYYETPSTWNRSPVVATIFTTYDAAAGHLTMFHKRDKAPKGWADGRQEVLDVVPLHTEIIHSPNGKVLGTP